MNLIRIISSILVLSVLSSVKPSESINVETKETLKRTDRYLEEDREYEYGWMLKKNDSHYGKFLKDKKAPVATPSLTSSSILNFALPSSSSSISILNVNRLLDRDERLYDSIDDTFLKKRDPRNDPLPSIPKSQPSDAFYERLPEKQINEYKESIDDIRSVMARQDSELSNDETLPSLVVEEFSAPVLK